MTDFDWPSTHPYRYRVHYLHDGREGVKEMAFTAPQDVASVQALQTDVTVVSVDVQGGRA